MPPRPCSWPAFRPCVPRARSRASATACSPTPSARSWPQPSSAAAPPCATSSPPTVPPGISNRNWPPTDAAANPAPTAENRCGRLPSGSGPRPGAHAASAEGYIGGVNGEHSLAETADITLWLDAARDGDRGALDRVLATLYQELHSMARRQLAGQQGHTLDATALVHEAYLKLIGRNAAQFEDRAHFFAYAASAMRSVVVDYARQRLAQKRGGDLHRVAELPEEIEGGLRLDEETLGLDTALTRLAAVDTRLAQVVE